MGYIKGKRLKPNSLSPHEIWFFNINLFLQTKQKKLRFYLYKKVFFFLNPSRESFFIIFNFFIGERENAFKLSINVCL